jgi:hypothetical protein
MNISGGRDAVARMRVATRSAQQGVKIDAWGCTVTGQGPDHARKQYDREHSPSDAFGPVRPGWHSCIHDGSPVVRAHENAARLPRLRNPSRSGPPSAEDSGFFDAAGTDTLPAWAAGTST